MIAVKPVFACLGFLAVSHVFGQNVLRKLSDKSDAEECGCNFVYPAGSYYGEWHCTGPNPKGGGCAPCGVNCYCEGAKQTSELCKTPVGYGPTCSVNASQCDLCPPLQHKTPYGCSECDSDADCTDKYKYKYKTTCFASTTGKCDNECGGDRGMKWCEDTYGNDKPFCLSSNNEDIGARCVQCLTFDSASRVDPNCDANATAQSHSKTPFCLPSFACGDCASLYDNTGECPTLGFEYAQVCTYEKTSDTCFAFPDAPCSAFSGTNFCPFVNADKTPRCKLNGNECVAVASAHARTRTGTHAIDLAGVSTTSTTADTKTKAKKKSRVRERSSEKKVFSV